MTKKTFKEGDVVFAKVKGYPPWPARVIAAGTGKYPVLFYGTNESANCKAQDIFLFEESKEKYGKNSKPAFVKAMNEAVAAIEGGGESTAAKRGRRSGSDGSEKSVVDDCEEDSDEEEVEVPQKKAKPAPKAKKTPAAAKKPPAKRTNKKLPLSDSESEDRPSSKASSKKSVKSTAKAAGRGQRRGAKSVSYVEEDSGDSDDESRSKHVASNDEPSQSEGDKSEDSASDTDQSDKGSDSEAKAVTKKTKKRPAAKRAAAKKKETGVGRKPRAKRAVKQKTRSVSESEGSKGSPPHSDNESVNSSASSTPSSSSSSSSGSSAGSGRSSTQPAHPPAELTAETAGEKEEKGDEVKDEKMEDTADVDKKAEDKTDGNEDMKGVEDAPDKRDESGGSEELAISKEHVEDITAADEDDSSRDSATNSSVEDEEIIHSSRAHKSLSKHAVLSESDSDEEDKSKKKEKGLEQMLEERQMEHQQLKMKRRQEKMEAKRQRQLQKEKEQEEERRLKEEKKRLHQQKIRTEKKIRELDEIIKRSLAVSTKDVAKCMDAMKELDGLDIVAAMLVKYPAIIDTLKKCRKYKADTAVMNQAESLCNKLRTIAASDKSALTALNKQKSDKLKVKKEEKVAEVKDEVKQEETTIKIENVDTKTSPSAPEDPKQEVKEKQEVVEANGSADQTHKSAPETTQEDMDIDNDSSAPGETYSVPVSADVIDSAHIEGSPANVDAPNSQQAVEDETPLPTAGSVADLRVMANEELPSEDALTAGLQALIAKTQQSSAILDQVIRQKKEKRSSGSSRKRRKLDSGLESSRSAQSHRTQTSSGRSAVAVTKTSSPTKQPEKVAKALNRKSTDLDELDIHDLLGI